MNGGEASTFALGAMMATVLLAARMGWHAVVLIGIARGRGAEGDGVLAAVVSLASLVAPTSGLGADFLAMHAVAQRPEWMQAAFRRAVRLTFASALPLLLLTGGIAIFAFGEHVSSLPIVAVLLTDVLMLRLCELLAPIPPTPVHWALLYSAGSRRTSSRSARDAESRSESRAPRCNQECGVEAPA